MDLKKDLQILIERTWSLHDDISDRIHDHHEKITTCNFCLDNGRHCQSKDKESLISIRDSLNHFQNMLISLQRQSSSHQTDRAVSIIRIDERRKMLMEEVRKFQGKKNLIVVEELNCCFGDELWIKNLIKGSDDVIKKRDPPIFVMRCVKSLISRFQWRNGATAALKFMVVSSLMGLIQTWRSSNSVMMARNKKRWMIDSRRSFDVFNGKG